MKAFWLLVGFVMVLATAAQAKECSVGEIQSRKAMKANLDLMTISSVKIYTHLLKIQKASNEDTLRDEELAALRSDVGFVQGGIHVLDYMINGVTLNDYFHDSVGILNNRLGKVALNIGASVLGNLEPKLSDLRKGADLATLNWELAMTELRDVGTRNNDALFDCNVD